MCDIFEACVHEAGHLWMLRKFGGDGYIEIFQNPIYSALEKDVLGRVVCTTQPMNIHQTKRTNILVGLAGHCAELMYFDPNTEWLACELEEFWEFDYHAISESDRNLTNNVTFNDFDECAELIKEGYSEILSIAKKQHLLFLKEEKPTM